jgi:hypothetical protein
MCERHTVYLDQEVALWAVLPAWRGAARLADALRKLLPPRRARLQPVPVPVRVRIRP